MRTFCIVFICIIFASGCRKDKDPASYEALKKNNAGTLAATVNGKPWSNNLVIAKVNPNSPAGKILLECYVYQDGRERQSIALNFIDPGKTEQQIYSNRIPTGGDSYITRPLDTLTGSFSLSDADVLENHYVVNDSATNNVLYVDYYNPSTSELRGRFQMTLYRTDIKGRMPTQGFSDTLRITNGTFNVKIGQ